MALKSKKNITRPLKLFSETSQQISLCTKYIISNHRKPQRHHTLQTNEQ